MQTFPPLCIYNFGLPRRTPSPGLPPRVISLRSSVLPAAHASPLVVVRARRHSSAATARERRWTFPRRRTEVDGAELTQTTTATNDEHGLGWAVTSAKT